jgi:Bacterial membrane protein YfhO
MNRVSRALKISVLLLVIVAGFYWKVTLTGQYDWMWSPDQATQVLPWFQVQARQWHQHGFPMWDQYLWGGQPLFGQTQPGAAYPLNWLLFWLPLDSAGQLRPLFLNWYFIAIHFMAAAFCYRLCRDLGRSQNASLLAAMIFAFAGYIGSTNWPQMLNGAVWIPLVFLYLLRAGAGKRIVVNGALAGAFFGIAFLSGHHQVPMFTSLAFAGVWLYFVFREGRPNWLMARAAAISLVFVVLCGAFQILPALEYGHLARRWVGAADSVGWSDAVPYYVHEKYSMAPVSFLGIVFPGMHEGVDPYIGIIALALAALAVAACWKDWRVRVLFAIGVGAMVYALGQLSVFQGVLYAIVPSLDKARSPASATVLFGFAGAVLAAFGFDRWLSETASVWPRRIMLATLGFGLLTVAGCLLVVLVNKMVLPGDGTVLTVALIAVAFAALMYALGSGNVSCKSAGVVAALLLVFELYQGSTNLRTFAARADSNRDRFMLSMTSNADVAAYLRNQPGFQRTEIPDETVLPNWGAYHDVPMFGGYLASVTANMLSFEFHRDQAKRLWGVAYQIAAKPSPYAGQEVFSGTSGIKVYKQPAAFPRAWAVHKLVRITSDDQANWYITERLDDLHSEAVMFDPIPAPPACTAPADSVELKEDRGSRVSLSVRLSCPAMIVVSDTYFPGWRAYVDGAPAPIYQVNGAMRGILAPAGVHSVTMRYRPMVVYEGAALTFLGILGAVLLARSKRL